MSDGPVGVEGPVHAVPSAGRPLAALGLAAGLALVLLAGEPGLAARPTFSTGAVLRALLLALLAAAVLLTAWAGPPSRPRLGRAAWLLVLPLAVPLLGLLAFGDDGWMAFARHASGWIALAALPVALLATWQGPADARRAWTAVLLAGCVAALFVHLEALRALMGLLRGAPTTWLAVGPFGRAGIAGPVLGALVGPALLLPLVRTRVLRWLPALLLAGACVATLSRTGLVAAALGTLVALAVGAPRPRTRRALRVVTALTLTLVVVLAGLAVEDVVPLPGGRRTVDVRLGLHRTSLALVAERPLRGYGLGHYATVALERRDLREARLEPGRRARHAHLDYLHASVEGGLLAGLALLGFVGALLAVGARRAGGHGPGGRALLAGACGVVATLGIAAWGDGVLQDPAAVLLMALAAATVLRSATGARTAAGLPWQAATVAAAAACLLCAYVLARDALADRDLMRYRHAIGHGVTLAEARAAAQEHLAEGALTWRPDAPEALYRLGVQRAAEGRYALARETYRRALAADPGMTEARLDLAQVYALEGRPRDAQAALEEAQRRDPTRFDVPRRLMELALGPEPVPGDAPTPMDEIEVLRRMNEARQVAPDRFETRVDEARYARRHGDLAEAGALLRHALVAAPGGRDDPPAEILIESFRLAETEDAASDLFNATILMQALQRNPRPAARLRAEAERFLDEGEARQDAALERAAGDPAALDMRAADRAFTAAAVRFTALLYVGLEVPERVLALARAERDGGRFRRALARYRSLLAWTLPPQGPRRVETLRGPHALEALARQGDLLLEASSVAHRVDGALSRFYRTQGQLRIGVELLETGRPEDALRKFKSVVQAAPDLADGRYGLARALARLGQEDEAEPHLLEALRLQPHLRGPALAEPDLTTLRRRAAVKAWLGIP